MTPSSPAKARRRPIRKQDAPALLLLEGVRTGIDAAPIDLSVPEGGTVTMFGNDGAALSRILDTVAGFAPLLGGRVLVKGRDVSTLRAGKRGVALVSARDPLFGHLSVHDNLCFPLRAQGKDRQAAQSGAGRMTALLGLEGLGPRKPAMLTVEQRLRVMLGRALLTEPAVLLLDDLLAGLDVVTTRRISTLLFTLSRALSLTVLQAVTGRGEALRSGGVIAVFEGGTLLQCADAGRLYEQPASPEVAIAFGEANALSGQVLDIMDDVARVHLACGGVAEAVAAEGLAVGQACLLCIRPDRVSPLFSSQMLALEDDLPPVQGVLLQSLHLGDHIRLRVRFADGSDMEISRPPLQARQIPSVGTPLQIAWPAAHATAFPLGGDLY